MYTFRIRATSINTLMCWFFHVEQLHAMRYLILPPHFSYLNCYEPLFHPVSQHILFWLMFSTNIMVNRKGNAGLKVLGSTRLKDSHAGHPAGQQIKRSESIMMAKFNKNSLTLENVTISLAARKATLKNFNLAFSLISTVFSSLLQLL